MKRRGTHCLSIVCAGIITISVCILSAPAASIDAAQATNAPPRRIVPRTTAPAIVAQLARQYPGEYGGMRQNLSGGLTVLTTGTDPSTFEAAVRAHTKHGTIAFSRTSHSEASLMALTTRILHDSKRISWMHHAVTRWGPNANRNKVVIYLLHPSNTLATRLLDRYGANWVYIARTPNGVAHPAAATRFNDSVPWNGGDSIFAAYDHYKFCTSGFAGTGIHTGNSYMVTAGHCVFLGSPVYLLNENGYRYATMGTATNVRLCNGCIDAATINGSYLGQIYGDYTTIYHVDGWDFAQPPAQVTSDGVETGEMTKGNVEGVNQCVVFSDDIERCHQTVVHHHPGCTGGDSGSPAYQHEANPRYSHVLAEGVNSGWDTNLCYYTQWKDIQNYFDLVIKVQ